ncbi:nuclease-related domain-containing protein [Fredinandcohnia humi]
MIMKTRSMPVELEILRSLSGRKKLDEKLENQLSSLEKGFKGELLFDQWLENINSDCVILNDLLLEQKNTQFQIDSLLVTQSQIYLFEVKNFEGDYYLDGDRWCTSSGIEIKSPQLQLTRSEALFRQLLHSIGFNNPIQTYLIFVNPEFYLYQTPLGIPIIFPTQINRFIINLYSKSSKLSASHHKLAQKLVSLHKQESPYMRIPNYSFEELKKGILCGYGCGEFMVNQTQNLLVCKKCGSQEKNESAIIRTVEEFKLLFPDQNVTTKNIFEWSNEIITKKTLQRILSKHYKTNERARASHYVKSEKQ